ncbi:MAG: tRNA uridine-5-carboxymethylaminomethyl(34) synthesis GTPase MnmE [Rhizobiaceae bacterium]|nr:tRNA uridine-5-carboxymethylaminomethyl(34) synthesis GTPase MnmE [Rhizobiaceae bacterium]
MIEDTIVALSSGALPAGIAVIRISGPAARHALEQLTGAPPMAREARLRRVRNAAGETIDRGIALLFDGPNTATGEDLCELHVHGGRAVVAACLGALTALPGVRLAEPGEFTRRAFENGRIDLTEAEGLADLLGAETEGQRLRAVRDAGGALRALYEGWMSRLVRARALLEASFDFTDEGDVSEDVSFGVRPILARLRADMKEHLAGARRGEILRHGFQIVIAGAPNAGKSSLLNALARRDVAIVSPVPGTTRDVIEVTLDLGGVPVRLVDTAGLRATSDPVEMIGVERAQVAMWEADLVLWLVDASENDALTHVKQRNPDASWSHHGGMEDRGHTPAPTLRIATKSDLPASIDRSKFEPFDLALSAESGEGVPALIERLAQAAHEAAGDPTALVPTRIRHREIVMDALRLLEEEAFEAAPPEIQAETLRRASDRLGALTGRIGVEDLLDVIFSQFCIGK